MITALNLGSGQRKFHSTPEIVWLNVDKVSRETINGEEEEVDSVPDICCDGASLPMEDDSVELVVLHHVWEHFGCGDGDGLVREAHRVLKVGGSLLIFVPDMKALAQRWLMGKMDDQLYFTNVYGAYQGHEEDRHKWGTTQKGLLTYLQGVAKWDRVSPFDNRPIPGSSIAADWWIAHGEAVK